MLLRAEPSALRLGEAPKAKDLARHLVHLHGETPGECFVERG